MKMLAVIAFTFASLAAHAASVTEIDLAKSENNAVGTILGTLAANANDLAKLMTYGKSLGNPKLTRQDDGSFIVELPVESCTIDPARFCREKATLKITATQSGFPPLVKWNYKSEITQK